VAHLVVGATSLDVVIARADGGDEARASIDHPSAGYGGHELVASPDGRHLALWLYSGQSEVGYELFETAPALRRLGGLPYVFGEGFGPVFSPDGRRLALAWAINSGLVLDDVELDDDGRAVAPCEVAWAVVRVADVVTGDAARCEVSVRLPAGFPYEGDDVLYPEALAFERDDLVRFDTAWGAVVQLPLPLPPTWTVDGPTVRGTR
jgi:hypothetical protein